MAKLGDYDLSNRMAKAIRKLATNVVNTERPKDQLAVVQSVDHNAQTATVLVQTDTQPVTLPYKESSAPTQTGDLVKVSSSSVGNMKIMSVEKSVDGQGGLSNTRLLQPLNLSVVRPNGSQKTGYTRKIKQGVLNNLTDYVYLGRWIIDRQAGCIAKVRIFYLGQRNGSEAVVEYRFEYDALTSYNGQGWRNINPYNLKSVYSLSQTAGIPVIEINPYGYLSALQQYFELRVRQTYYPDNLIFTATIEIDGLANEDTSVVIDSATYNSGTNGTETIPTANFNDTNTDLIKFSFSNGWGPYTASTTYASGSWILQDGWVSCTGLIVPGTLGQTACQVPANLGPSQVEAFTTLCGSTLGYSRIDVYPDGSVFVRYTSLSGSNLNWVSLAGLRWKVNYAGA